MKITEMLQLGTHDEVVDVLLRNTNTDYNIIRGDTYCIIAHKSITFSKPAPMLCVHTDTVSKTKPTRFKVEGNILSNPDGVLGADDRAGCWIVNELLKSKEDRFIFGVFDMEETGCIGSGDLTKNKVFNELFIDDDRSKVSCFIGLDRRGTNQVAWYSSHSSKFKLDIQDTFPNLVDAQGSITDASYLSYHYGISCCNISVGYDCEHTKNETLDLDAMNDTLAMLRVTDIHKLREEIYDVPKFENLGTTRWWDEYEDNVMYYDDVEPVCCDICGSHAPLYTYKDTRVMMNVCKECL